MINENFSSYAFAQYSVGRVFIGRMPRGKDIIHVVKDFCGCHEVIMAAFFVSGAVSSFTIGTFDQKQQVYVTSRYDNPGEIVGCTGSVLYNEKYHVHAQIILADESGRTSGGHLFSETLIYAGEMHLFELLGPAAARKYDPLSGRMLWDGNNKKT